MLVKAQGKFTTDHISMAGPWLKYRGHLENISGNLYLGAVSAFNEGIVGMGKNQLTGERMSFPDLAKAYHEAEPAVGRHRRREHGRGFSREHAAMEPRFRGCQLILARSFARIHETNLKKQGIVPADLRRPGRLRQDRRGRSPRHSRPGRSAPGKT